MAQDHHQEVFHQLKSILTPYADEMIVQQDRDDMFYLESKQTDRKGRPLFFGSVMWKKNYISFHLMPVYMYPELLEDISPDLKKRMQGKSCFNFKQPEKGLFHELRKLTEKGNALLEERGSPV